MRSWTREAKTVQCVSDALEAFAVGIALEDVLYHRSFGRVDAAFDVTTDSHVVIAEDFPARDVSVPRFRHERFVGALGRLAPFISGELAEKDGARRV